MRKLILAARSGLLRSAVVAAPIVIASACSESGSNFFTPTTGGTGGVMSGGTGGVGTGGTSGTGSGGTANATSGGMGATGGGSVAGAGGMMTGGTAGTGGVGTGGDAPTAGTGGTDATGGTAGSDASGGEGGSGNEGGMEPTAGTAGSTGGDAGSGTTAGTSGSAGDAGTGGVAGTGGGAGAGMGGVGGTAGAGGTAGMGGMAGTGGTGCVPKPEVCDGEDNDCGDDEDEGGVCPPGCHGATFGGRSFLLCTVNNGVNWDEALDFCQDLATDPAPVAVAGPMTLVQVDSAEENTFLQDWIVALNIDDNVWLGANDAEQEGRWFWDRGTGAPVPFLTVVNNNRTIIDGRYNDFPSGIFLSGASGADCAHFDPAEDWRWDDRSCTMDAPAFICGEIK